MSREPKGQKGMRRKLLREMLISNKEAKKAIFEASKVMDLQTEEIKALRRILISERAQVIYYTDKYLACLKKECLDLQPVGFLCLPESEQEPYVKRAIEELSDAQGVVPHDQDARHPQTTTVAKNIILPE